MEIVKFAQVAPTPWKNGLGMTTQLAIYPPHATAGDFDWRVSIARLDVSAPFSIYARIERCLAVLQGELTLAFAEREPLTLTPESQPVRFAGTEAVTGQVVRGPVLDLNVMCRSPQWRATMRRMRWSSDTSMSTTASGLLCSLADEMNVEIDGSAVQLSLYDVVHLRRDASIRITVSRPVEAYLVEIERQGPGAAND